MKRQSRRFIKLNTDWKQYRIIIEIPVKEGRLMKLEDSVVERGSGNVYEDLGFPDSDTQLLKSEHVTRIELIIRQRGLKQIDAANLLGLSQSDVSRLLRGQFQNYSVERLFRLLMALGHDVNIVIHKSHSERKGRIHVET